jgi:hypothetical protein
LTLKTLASNYFSEDDLELDSEEVISLVLSTTVLDGVEALA